MPQNTTKPVRWLKNRPEGSRFAAPEVDKIVWYVDAKGALQSQEIIYLYSAADTSEGSRPESEDQKAAADDLVEQISEKLGAGSAVAVRENSNYIVKIGKNFTAPFKETFSVTPISLPRIGRARTPTNPSDAVECS